MRYRSLDCSYVVFKWRNWCLQYHRRGLFQLKNRTCNGRFWFWFRLDVRSRSGLAFGWDGREERTLAGSTLVGPKISYTLRRTGVLSTRADLRRAITGVLRLRRFTSELVATGTHGTETDTRAPPGIVPNRERSLFGFG